MNFENSLWQSKAWEQFQNACGNKAFRTDGVLVIERKMALEKTFLEVPRVQIESLSQTFWQKLKAEAQKRKVIFTRIFPADKNSSQLPLGKGGNIRTRGVPEIFPEHTLVIDLNQSEEEILQGMKQKGRYNIKLAQGKGVEVFSSNNVSEFYKLLQETTSRDKFSAHPQGVYEKMLESFGEDGLLLLAKYEENIIAGGIFLKCADVLTYYYGASANEHRNVMAPVFIAMAGDAGRKKKRLRMV